MPDERRGSVVKAFIVLAEGHEGSDELVQEIQAHVRNRLSAYAYPRRIEFVEDLPKTLTGKIRRIELRQRELEGYRCPWSTAVVAGSATARARSACAASAVDRAPVRARRAEHGRRAASGSGWWRPSDGRVLLWVLPRWRRPRRAAVAAPPRRPAVAGVAAFPLVVLTRAARRLPGSGARSSGSCGHATGTS